jgi:hypothetical protein
MQKRRWGVLGGVLLTLLICLRPVRVGGQDERLVLAFYYAWFDMQTWEKPLPDRPLQRYHSADVSAIERHVLEAQEAGIDALVQAWYGPEMENNQTETNFRILLDQAMTHGMQAAVSVDLGGDFLQSEVEILDALHILREGHAQHPAYLRVAGRPVVFFWRQENGSVPHWESVRDQVDPNTEMIWIAEGGHPAYLEVFDGLYLYNIAWAEDPEALLVRWANEVRQWSANHNAFRYWVATVMPGYDDTVTGSEDALIREREEGAFYRACWEGALASTADWVVITSFNEWLEGTHIEPSVNYGDTYIRMTAELAANYRTASFEPTPTATPVVTPTATPIFTPTVTPVLTPTATFVSTTITPTLTPHVTPTATLTPTATPFRLSTPTPFPPSAPTSSPLTPASLTPPPPPVHGGTPPPPVPGTSPTPVRRRTMMPVEGETPRRTCAWMPTVLSLLVLWGRNRRGQRRRLRTGRYQ